MQDALAQPFFDYTSLDNDTAQFVQNQTSEIRKLWGQSLQNMVEIGQRLIQVKGRLGHGNFGSWLDVEFDWNPWLAQKFMQVAEKFKNVNFTDLEISTSAAYILAAPSTPPEVFAEAIAQAETGKKITYTGVRELKDKYNSLILEPQARFQPDAQPSQSYASTTLPELQPEPQSQLPPLAIQTPSHPVTNLKITTPTKRPRVREQRPSVVTPKQVANGELWKLGNDNYLYCGAPTSADFQKLLPQKFALLLTSPPSRGDWPQLVPQNAISAASVFTPYQEDQDLTLLREIMERYIQLYTAAGDTVALSFLPDPAILRLIERLECRFFCADPDSKRCDAAITVWTTLKGTVEKIKRHQLGKKQLSSPALAR